MDRTASLVGAVKNFELVVINSTSGEYIGDKFQDCGLSTPVSNKETVHGVFDLFFAYSLICS